jgi:hypothetical protein
MMQLGQFFNCIADHRKPKEENEGEEEVDLMCNTGSSTRRQKQSS